VENKNIGGQNNVCLSPAFLLGLTFLAGAIDAHNTVGTDG